MPAARPRAGGEPDFLLDSRLRENERNENRRVNSSRSVPELLADNTLVQAVAGIEQHMHGGRVIQVDVH